MPRRPYTRGRCESCGSNRLLKYAKRTHCCRYLCQKAATALIAAAEEDAAEADTPNFLKEIKFILGQRFCDPEELNGEKLRNTLSSSDITRCFQIDGIFAASDSDDGFREKRWVEIEELVEKIPKLDLSGALRKWRAKEAADAEKEVTRLMLPRREREEIDRSFSVFLRQVEWSRGFLQHRNPGTR